VSTASDALAAEALAASDALPAAALHLARRFSAGATLWAIAPRRDDHARHVAVEFVHPVIVGTRSLPAAAVVGNDLVSQARVDVQSGDILLLIGEADLAPLVELAARSVAWGASTVWLVLSEGPPIGSAGFVLHCADEADIVRSYHLIWELCHVCLQHPGVLGQDDAADDTGCAVCADEAVTAEVLGRGDDGQVRLRTGCGPIDAIDMLGDVHIGDLVMAHAGVVIGRCS
jgi:hypothetical protein